MSLRQMEFVLKIAEYRSFTKAANKLKITQPSLSHAILSLEENLGLTLFDRTTPIKLTRAGEIYVSKAKLIIDLYDDLNSELQDISGKKTGEIRIGFSTNGYMILSDVLPKFCRRFPSVNIKIEQTRSLAKIRQMILDNEIDIGLFISPIEADELETEVIKTEKMYIALCLAHELSQKYKSCGMHPKISLNELKNENFILQKSTQRTRAEIDEVFKKAGFEPNIICETEIFDIAISMAASGAGAYFCLQSYIKNDVLDQITLFDIDEPSLDKTTMVAYKKGKKLSKLAKEFIQIAKEW